VRAKDRLRKPAAAYYKALKDRIEKLSPAEMKKLEKDLKEGKPVTL